MGANWSWKFKPGFSYGGWWDNKGYIFPSWSCFKDRTGGKLQTQVATASLSSQQKSYSPQVREQTSLKPKISNILAEFGACSFAVFLSPVMVVNLWMHIGRGREGRAGRGKEARQVIVEFYVLTWYCKRDQPNTEILQGNS